MNSKVSLIRESYDVDTNEQERTVYSGKLVSLENNVFLFAFKVDESIMRLKMSFLEQKCFVEQSYPTAEVKFTLQLNKKEEYCLTLNKTYKLLFITEASLIKYNDFEIELKYNLYEESSKKLISLNKISIVGE